MTAIIADACSNHLGDRRLIDTMIQKSAGIGVDIIKFQAFKSDSLNKFFPNYKESYEYYKTVELGDSDLQYILEKCMKEGIKPLVTAFDLERAKILRNLDFGMVKIASPDANNFELIKFCIDNFYRVFISTGMHTDIEIKRLRDYVRGHHNVTLFYCVSKYPTLVGDIDFDKMLYFDGFSDHTLGTEASKKAIDLGMDYIEKHLTLGRELPGRDQAMSTTLDEFRELVQHRDYVKKIPIYKNRWG